MNGSFKAGRRGLIIMVKTSSKLRKTIIVVAVVVAEMLLGAKLVALAHSNLVKVLISDSIFVIGFLIVLGLFHDVLRRDWQLYRQHLWRNLGLGLLSLIGTYGILYLSRWGLSLFGVKMSAVAAPAAISMQAVTVIGTVPTILAPFSEEMIFRHGLFYQWKDSRILGVIMFFVSSIAFGLAHWNNFNGHLVLMIPYMCVGAWFAFIYWRSRNIWQNIMAHFFFDFPNVLAAIFLLILSSFQ